MNTITLQSELTGETVNFATQKAAAKFLNVTPVAVHYARTGRNKAPVNGEWRVIAGKPDQTPTEQKHDLYWRIYNSL